MQNNGRSSSPRARARPAPGRRPEARLEARPEERSEPRAPVVEEAPKHTLAKVSIASIARAASLGSIPAAPSRVDNLVKPAAHAAYKRQDLYAIAELAYHYVFSGGVEIAFALLQGLVEIAPDEAYFALMFGLVEDKRGELERADQWYAKAAQLDPRDPRADINRAELRIERKDFKNARALLVRGVKKARARDDADIEHKATTMLEHIAGK